MLAYQKVIDGTNCPLLILPGNESQTDYVQLLSCNKPLISIQKVLGDAMNVISINNQLICSWACLLITMLIYH